MNLGRISRRWLLWLALILPVAQAMAGVHALSHLDERQGDGIAHLVHCDLCLAAAHLDAGAPAAEARGPVAVAASHAAPPAARCPAPRAARPGLPPARAPPVSA
ncbi:MAG: hypothetical protein QM788_01545 [Roseateles sp.]|uniref:hypothetical protein n=1 Tax=Roseateles sp. TaxID=1971397 RepID=UPI0039E95C6C